MDQFIDRSDQVSSFGIFMRRKTKIIFLQSQITLNHTFSGFCKNKLVRAQNFNGGCYSLHIDRLQTMGDKGKVHVVETLYENDTC